ncbi:chromobox protein homolog 5 isoform X4 [Solenopsis invicta]|uniref:chromobox protein homolog 5 isoform X4 n=1 Tax=Solenopsis invicta TaxID=13686 RepID=UPI000596327C|nr:chromobox protein homolog 5 isoform X4 [Solenopsis invicta]
MGRKGLHLTRRRKSLKRGWVLRRRLMKLLNQSNQTDTTISNGNKFCWMPDHQDVGRSVNSALVHPNPIVKTETDLCEDTEVKENSCTDPLDEMSNRKQTMQADDCRRQGFRRGLEADKILGSADDNGELMYLIQWKGTDAVDMVSAKEANAKCPQIVIRFYEDRITWNKAKISA